MSSNKSPTALEYSVHKTSAEYINISTGPDQRTKRRKYENLDESLIFVSFGVETLGPWGPGARALFEEISKRVDTGPNPLRDSVGDVWVYGASPRLIPRLPSRPGVQLPQTKDPSPCGALEAPLSLETPGESEPCPPHALTSIPGSESLLNDLGYASAIASASSSASASASVNNVSHQYKSTLHVPFHAQSPLAPVSVSSSSSSSIDEDLSTLHVPFHAQSPLAPVSVSSSSCSSIDEDLSTLHVPFHAQSPLAPVSVSSSSCSSIDEDLSTLHVPFHAQSSPAPVSDSSSSFSSSINEELSLLHVKFDAQSPPTSVSISSCSSSNSINEELSPLHVQFHAQSPPTPVLISSSSSSSSDDEELSITQAGHPNGLWRWVIVFAAFNVNLIADGIKLNFGLFFPDFLDYFGERKEKAARITEIFIAMPLLCGPIASFLTDKYGCRRMTIFGSFLAALGFITSAFVDNMETFMFTYVIMAGFGLSLCYVAAVVIVAYYFGNKCALATGYSMCGSGIGTFIFAPLINDWLDKYGWRGTTIILAGPLLNMVVCGLLFRELPWMITMNEDRAKQRQRRRDTNSKSSAAGSTKATTNAVDIEAVTTSIVPQYSSLVDLPTYMTGDEGVSLETFELMFSRGRAYGMLAQNHPGTSRSFSDSGRLHELSPPKTLMSPEITSPNNSVPSAPEINGITQLNNNAALWLLKQMQRYAGLCWDLLVDILGFSLLLNPAFLVFAVSYFLLHMWNSMPHMYIADNNLGMTLDDYSTLTSSMSLISILSEILLGWIGNSECVSPIQVYAVCMILCGLVTAIMPLLTTYLGLGIASRAFSIFFAANYSLTGVILVEQVTLEKFTKAYGLLLFVHGLASFTVPPLIEWIFEITNNYDLLCYLAGGFMGLSGLILVVLPLYNAVRRRDKPRSTDRSANISTNMSVNKSASYYEMHSISNTNVMGS
ncbi:uncharacterized protein LOC123872090 [Maniola jurtina]|uniref:uncharacterized protein LOC123872090 n=1 Tax=Maniola jurtina TaxID=191418 RepID=UPI001E68AD43|nr:uncharacterized protein LOC123872090 [Maniola jurtina]